MADASKGGAGKLSTKDILAAARAEAAKKAGGTPAPEAAAPAPEEAAPAPAAPKPAAAKPAAAKPAAGGAKPKSTADILAAARAQAGGGGAAPAASEAAPAAAKPAAAKPAPGAKPKSTADILAAARAGAGGKAAPAAPAGEKPVPKAKPAAAAAAAPGAAEAAASGLSVEQMLAAVRPAGAPAEATAAAAKPAKPTVAPPMPPKPAPAAAKKGAGADVSRRSLLWIALLSPFALAWWLMGATTAVFALATARFMMPNVLTEPPRKFKIGPPTDYDLGTVATKLVAQYGVWIVHTDQYKSKNVIYALASVCTHLGCTPSWLEGEQKFKCPCHGSGFYITGINFEGPAPRPLERVGIRIAADGMLEVDKSLKFQEEMGQWADPASFYEVVG